MLVACFILLVAVVLFFIITYCIYQLIFSNKKRFMGDDSSLPEGQQYTPYHDTIKRCVQNASALSYEDIYITSDDGIRLHAKYYEKEKNAPLIIFFHGYRCSALRDGNGILLYSQREGYNALMADLRAHGKSQGKTITFGIRERFDVKKWAEYAYERFGADTPIILAGLSMGAATVMMASDLELPPTVKGVIADCGYSSPSGIIKTVMASLKLPVRLLFPFVKLGAKIYGHFDLEEHSAREALQNTSLPVLLIHGDDDRFVPCKMSQDCYDVCHNHKDIVIIETAGHGLCHCVDVKKYEDAVDRFLTKIMGMTH